MPQSNQLPVNNARLEVNPKTGVVTLLVRDPRISGGEPLRVEMPYESEAAQKAYELLQAESVVSEQSQLPEESVFPKSELDPSQLLREVDKAKMEIVDDSRLKFLLGEVEDNKYFEFDLGFSSHTLIFGSEDSGKTTLLQNLARQALAKPGTEVYYADFETTQAFFQLKDQLRPQDILATNPEEFDALVSHLKDTVDYRSRILDAEKASSWQKSQYPMVPILLFVDNPGFYEDKMRSNIHKLLQVLNDLHDLFRQGLQRVGIYVLMTSDVFKHDKNDQSRFFDKSVALSIRSHVSRRIILGDVDAERQEQLLGVSIDRHQQDLLTVVGRGAVTTFQDEPQLFQGFKEPEGTDHFKRIAEGVWAKK